MIPGRIVSRKDDRCVSIRDGIFRSGGEIGRKREWRAKSSPRHERLASVSFGRNTDRLSKRHEATAKTNLKCLLTKQSELAALPAHGGKLAGSRRFTPLYGHYLARFLRYRL